MHAEVVERRRWLDEALFLRALNVCTLLPGPEAQQLATYLGWRLHGLPGALTAGGLFILPGLVLVAALALAYARWGATPLATQLLWGLRPAVVALVMAAAWRLGQRVLGDNPRRALALGAALLVGLLAWPYPVVVVLAAAVGGWLRMGAGSTAPSPVARSTDWRRQALRVVLAWLVLGGGTAAALALWTPGGLLPAMAGFFTRAAWLGFGGAYAVLPYVQQGAVEGAHWLTPVQMLDGLALGETTPGPLILIVTWVGMLGGWSQPAWPGASPWASALAGCAVSTFFTFLPSFAWVLLAAPWVESGGQQARWQPALSGISAAMVGVMAQLALRLLRDVGWPLGMAAAPDGLALAAVAVSLVLLLVRGWSAPQVVGLGLATGLVRAWA